MNLLTRKRKASKQNDNSRIIKMKKRFLCIVLAAQRYIVQGMTAGAVKG